MFQLLVEGYIHELRKQLNGQIVPTEIIRICIQYFYGNSQMIFMTDVASAQFSLYLTDVASATATTPTTQTATPRALHSVWKCNPSQKTTLKFAAHSAQATPLVLDSAGICTKKNVLFPSYITQQLRHSTGINAIFKCGGLPSSPSPSSSSLPGVIYRCPSSSPSPSPPLVVTTLPGVT
mmetsp:Transcript_27389/g.45036  ORF Transcript_27389/g.45036 Transcript_27389/m.45036 type:complete len:179 (-) Transcript_27389:656-1192(-)